ncbi:hypothetical protein D3C75_1253690 [compost metagenome]
MCRPHQRVVLIDRGLQGELVDATHQHGGLFQCIVQIMTCSGAEQAVLDSPADAFAETADARSFEGLA